MAFVEDIYDIVNTAVEYAFFQEKYQLNFFEYLKSENFKKEQVTSFIHSTLFVSLKDQVEEMDIYLAGGDSAALLREAYGWMGKPRARKVRDYLNTIIDDAHRYEKSKRKGRKSTTKKKKESETANK